MSKKGDEIRERLRVGECSAKKRHEAPCPTCDKYDELIAYIDGLEDVADAARDLRDALPPVSDTRSLLPRTRLVAALARMST